MSEGRYYHLWIAASEGQSFFPGSFDKAYFISLLQDLLSPRIHFSTAQSPVDLVVFALTSHGVNLLVFAIDQTAVTDFGQNLLLAYADYLNEQGVRVVLPFDTIFAHERLRDEHEALNISRQLHLLPEEWRSDRYTSIGFYLDDRRGDWLQAWRISNLYHNDVTWYEAYLEDGPYYPIEVVPELNFIET